eukprot:TRINITY_DN19298_c0_g1_i2.p1 TRINITY_DN19298_c0_g1~~TRINITY_DN19298_c0_g1_i2.p1  ORF type:complete len:319 (-),score=-23.58 TRINITY_DN19298_c0_g1_i2:38-994(-)
MSHCDDPNITKIQDPPLLSTKRIQASQTATKEIQLILEDQQKLSSLPATVSDVEASPTPMPEIPEESKLIIPSWANPSEFFSHTKKKKNGITPGNQLKEPTLIRHHIFANALLRTSSYEFKIEPFHFFSWNEGKSSAVLLAILQEKSNGHYIGLFQNLDTEEDPHLIPLRRVLPLSKELTPSQTESLKVTLSTWVAHHTASKLAAEVSVRKPKKRKAFLKAKEKLRETEPSSDTSSDEEHVPIRVKKTTKKKTPPPPKIPPVSTTQAGALSDRMANRIYEHVIENLEDEIEQLRSKLARRSNDKDKALYEEYLLSKGK